MKRLFHVTSTQQWQDAQVMGVYRPTGYDAEGFIHCSYTHQVPGVLERFFRGQTGLVALEIDAKASGGSVVDENLEGGEELFPHLYGPLPCGAVVAVHRVRSAATWLEDLPPLGVPRHPLEGRE